MVSEAYFTYCYENVQVIEEKKRCNYWICGDGIFTGEEGERYAARQSKPYADCRGPS